MTHTKGPWGLDFRHKDTDRKDGNGSIIEVTRLGDGCPQSICTIWTVSLHADNFDDEGRANANLIAAAPELLDALEMVRDYMHAAGKHNDISPTCEVVHNAIKKAKGE